MSVCPVCEAPTRTVWPPRSDTPKLEVIEQAGWNLLAQCSTCMSLWDRDDQEPFGSFRYYTYWPWPPKVWHTLASYQNDLIVTQPIDRSKMYLEMWKASALWDAVKLFGEDDLIAVRKHQARSRGLVPEVLNGIRPVLDMNALVAKIECGAPIEEDR